MLYSEVQLESAKLMTEYQNGTASHQNQSLHFFNQSISDFLDWPK